MTDRLISVEQCHTLSVDEIERQIKVREDLIRQMVGTLYPNILSEEIRQLHFMINYRKKVDDDYDRAMGAL